MIVDAVLNPGDRVAVKFADGHIAYGEFVQIREDAVTIREGKRSIVYSDDDLGGPLTVYKPRNKAS